MDQFVSPILFNGLQELAKRRPDKPIEFLAYYLIEKNPLLQDRIDAKDRDLKESIANGLQEHN